MPSPGNPQSLNRFAYVVNNPLGLVDPSGHTPMLTAGGGYAVIPYTPPSFMPIPGWSPSSQYSEWSGSRSSSYSGCFRCHAAVANGQSALTNDQLAAVHNQMNTVQERGLEIVLRSFEPVDYLFTMKNCIQNNGCDPDELYWTTVPLAAGTLGTIDNLPIWQRGQKTYGFLDTGSEVIPLQSGRNGFASRMPDNTPGMRLDMAVRDHVEAHAAAYMRQNQVMEAALYINKAPCPGIIGCDRMLPHMLPEGATLDVYIKTAGEPRHIQYSGESDSVWGRLWNTLMGK